MNKMPNRLKELVSKNKIRYQADGFDLDLAYINKNIIAMGFPAENLEGVYRNHLEDVQRFLEMKHENRYKIYNLCLEREYLPTKFKGVVTKYPFKDHNPPPLTMMMDFCRDVRDWLSEDKENVAVIHCKAGKGRTGVMICAYLVYSEHMTAEQALSFYGKQRTKDSKGVTIPSQRRYVHYFSRLCHPSTNHHYTPVPLRLVAFKFSSIPNFTSGHNCNIYFTIQDDFSFGKFDTVEAAKKGDQNVVIRVDQPCRGDAKIEIGCRSIIGKESMFHFWFNTFFVEKSETVDLGFFHSIGSRRAPEAVANPSTGPINISNNNNNNNVQRRSSFRSGDSASYSSSFCEADLGGRHNFTSVERRNLLQPEMKKELITKALCFMQRGHRSHQLGEELVGFPKDQVLTSFKSRDSTTGNGVAQISSDGNLLSAVTKRSPSSPRMLSKHNRSQNNLNEEIGNQKASQTYKTLALTKPELDKANKDKQHKVFPPDFKLTAYFTTCSSGNYDQHHTSVYKETDDEDDDTSDDDEADGKIIV